MGVFDKYNKIQRTVREGIDTDGWDFKKLEEFQGLEIPVNGFFFTDSRYGKQVVVVGDGVLVNMPKRCTEEFLAFRDDPDVMAVMLSGKMVLTDIKPHSGDNGKTTIYTYTEV